MSDRLKTLRVRFAHAEADADASIARVRRQSAARLDDLLNDPDPKRQIAGLRDPTLTPFDRSQLEQRLSGKFRSRPALFSATLRDRLHSVLREATYHRRALIRTAILATFVTTVIVTSYAHTPIGRPVRLDETFDITWRFPDGSSRSEQEERGTRLILVTKPSGYVLRRWFNGAGYGERPIGAPFANQYLDPSD